MRLATWRASHETEEEKHVDVINVCLQLCHEEKGEGRREKRGTDSTGAHDVGFFSGFMPETRGVSKTKTLP